jgi:hypothetical protein
MVDEVFASEGVDEVPLAAAMRGRDRDQLAVAGRVGKGTHRAEHPIALFRQQRGRDEEFDVGGHGAEDPQQR